MVRFGGLVVMGCPFDRSPAQFGSLSAEDHPAVSSAQAEPHAASIRGRRPTRAGPRPCSSAIIDQILTDDEDAPAQATPHRRPDPSAASAKSTHYPGGYAQVQRYILRRHRRPTSRNLHPSRPSPGTTTRSRLRPHPRRLPRRSHAWSPSSSPPGPTPMPRSSWPCPSSGPRPSSKAWSPPSSSSARVPREVWWDNPKTVATLILQRARTPAPSRDTRRWPVIMCSIPKFCMPARGNEKPDAESTVKAVQKRFATPVPRVNGSRRVERRSSIAGAWPNATGSFGRSSARSRSRTGSPRISPRRCPCPTRPVRGLRDPSRRRRGQVPIRGLRRQSLQRPPAVRLRDGHRQGLRRPRRDRLGRPGRGHSRAITWRSHTMILDPLHFLATLDRKPGVARPRAGLSRLVKLPACFADLPGRLERQHGPDRRCPAVRPGLATAHRTPLDPLSSAIETCMSEQLRHRRRRDPPDCGPSRRSRPPRVPTAHTSGVLHIHPGRRAAARPEPVRPTPGHAATTARSACSTPDRLIFTSLFCKKDLADGRCHDRVAQDATPTAPPADDGPRSSRGWRGTPPRTTRRPPSCCCD